MASLGIGVTLRQERLRQGLTLEEIADQTKISTRFLGAIEAENFDRLPGLVFTRNFVRQYASVLKMDSAPLMAELPRPDLSSAPMPSAPRKVEVSNWDPRWNSAIVSIVWFALAAGAGIAAYVHYNRPAQVAPGKPPDTTQTRSPAKAAATAERTPGTAAVASASEPASPAPTQSIQVVLTAREACWLQVTADGKTAFTGTLQPNDSQSFSANELVKIVAGNAGGISISLNGRQLDSIGPSGQVRVVRLTAEGLQLTPKTPPPAPDPL